MKRVIHTDKAPKAIGPYSQAIQNNGTLYISGQIPVNPETGKIAETIEEQTEQVMQNIGAILKEAGYTFADVVKSTCDHFRETTKMIALAKGAQREVQDFMLTRYACYLIAQNGDPKKEEVAFAQSYFAVQTRKAELIEERLNLLSRLETRNRLRASEKQLSQNIYERGVDDRGFGRIRSKGDRALFGGHTTEDMKKRLGGQSNRPLADFLPTLTIAAKNLATEMTNYNVETKDLYGESSITSEHIQNNTSVREMLGKRGIKPENLPPAEDIKKLERRVDSEQKKIEKATKKLPKK